jgi:hypothetical protein
MGTILLLVIESPIADKVGWWKVETTMSIMSFYLHAEAPNIVPLPTKVEYLDGITIEMAALGSEHSLAISGMQ